MTNPMSADGDRVSGDGYRPVGRVRFMDAQRVNLDGFAREEPGLGLVALRSPEDTEPGLVISGGRVTRNGRRAGSQFRRDRRLHRAARP